VFNFSINGSLSEDLPDSHEYEKSRYLHKGKENIINFLEKLPKSKHDYGSFVVDVPLANVSILFF